MPTLLRSFEGVEGGGICALPDKTAQLPDRKSLGSSCFQHVVAYNALVVVSQEIGLEVNADGTKRMVMSRY